jgi:GH35 family endo-1,4-beta-xylanase
MHASLRRFPFAALWAAGAVVALSVSAQTPPTAPAAASAAPVTAYAPAAPASATLKDTFKRAFHVGVAITPNQINGQNPKAADMILREFDSISPENIMKMGPIHPRAGNDDSSYDFAPADAYVDFGVKNHLFVIGHNLCWHSQMPGWMSQPEAGQTELTKEVLTQRLKDHIFKVAGRYKGKINGWDVVNEALADNPGQAGDMPYGLRANSPFNRVFKGPEYILMAFKWAHEADATAELYYNDYNLDAADTSDYKRANAIALLKYLKENGAPITGVGMQGHYNMEGPSIGKIDETIGMFEALGLKVHVTELDVRANAGANGAALTGAVAGGGQPPARGGRGGGRGGLPAPDALKASLNLSDEQVAKITPLLDAHTANVAAAAGDFAKIGASRTSTIAALRPILTPAQQKSFDEQFRPQAGGGAPVGAAPVPLSPAEQQALAKRYGQIFEVFLKHKGIARVTFWGLHDGVSWRRANSPLLFDANFDRKPAYDAVIAAAKKAAN